MSCFRFLLFWIIVFAFCFELLQCRDASWNGDLMDEHDVMNEGDELDDNKRGSSTEAATEFNDGDLRGNDNLENDIEYRSTKKSTLVHTDDHASSTTFSYSSPEIKPTDSTTNRPRETKETATAIPRKTTTFFQDFFRSSTSVLGHIHQELELLNKHLDAMKASFVRFERNLKEEMMGIQEEIQSLKMSVIELETDVQTSGDTVERIAEWSTGVNAKFQSVESAIRGSCKTNTKRFWGESEELRCPKACRTLRRKKMGASKRKVTEDLIFLKPRQADSDVPLQVEDVSPKSELMANVREHSCSMDIKGELENFKKHFTEICRPRPSSCVDIKKFGARKNGEYAINPWMSGYDWSVTVYCDLQTDGGGWTTIQRRNNYGLPKENFTRNWKEYKAGFGDINREFWLGLDNIFALTNQEPVLLRVELENFKNESRYAEYFNFKLNSETDKYRMSLGPYSGDAADSLSRCDGMQFSTYDSDNDKWSGNCAKRFKGGWWFNNCHDANLNGCYYDGSHESYADGVNWYHWMGFHYSLKRAEMKIRPMSFQANVKT